MPLFRKNKAPPTEPDRDRLTVSLWPFKIDASGKGVPKAYVLGFTVCALWFASLVLYAVKPFAIPWPATLASGLLQKAR